MQDSGRVGRGLQPRQQTPAALAGRAWQSSALLLLAWKIHEQKGRTQKTARN